MIALHLDLPRDVEARQVDEHVLLEEAYDLPSGLGQVCADIRRYRRELGLVARG